MGLLSFLIMFQANGSQVIEKDTPGFETVKRLEEDLHIKGSEIKFTVASFLKQML